MLKRNWSITFVAISSTALAAALSTLALHSTRADAQNPADCQILSASVNNQAFAGKISTFVANGYVVSGFSADGNYLYTLVCRK